MSSSTLKSLTSAQSLKVGELIANWLDKIEWVYYIVSTYMFLNVIGQPASVMVVRGNLMKIVRPKAY